MKSGIGFFFKIPSKNYKFFLTNSTILDQKFIEKEKKLILYNKINDKTEIDLTINRYKMTDSELNFTIIEILDEDNITNFFELDDLINSKDYKDEEIISFDFSEGKPLNYSYGKCLGKNNDEFLYSCDINEGFFYYIEIKFEIDCIT